MAKYVYSLAAVRPRDRQRIKTCSAAKGRTCGDVLAGHPGAGGLHGEHRVLHRLLCRRLQAPGELTGQVLEALHKVEAIMGMKYGDAEAPLLVSCRSAPAPPCPA
jgi:pyruvate,orthophosphate dikinase